MTIENGANRIANRLVEIVTLYQNSEESGYRTRPKVAGAFENSWKQVEDRGCIALLTRRLSGGETNLALRHRETRDRIHDQENVCSLIAEVFGYRQSHETGTHTQERRTVRCG